MRTWLKLIAIAAERFLADRRGLAALEFALLAPVLSFFLILVADFGLVYNVKLRLLSAIAAGAQYAQTNGSSVTSSNFAAFSTSLTTIVRKVAGSNMDIAVTTAINNSADGSNAGNYYCVSGSPINWTQAVSSSAACGTDLTAGRYVTITLTGSCSTIFTNDPIVGALIELSETIIVRVN